MAKDDSALATKKDIALLIAQMNLRFDVSEERTEHLLDRKLAHALGVFKENLVEDFQASLREDPMRQTMKNHVKRIRRLEHHVGIAA
jgi:hypothetical protein